MTFGKGKSVRLTFIKKLVSRIDEIIISEKSLCRKTSKFRFRILDAQRLNYFSKICFRKSNQSVSQILNRYQCSEKFQPETGNFCFDSKANQMKSKKCNYLKII